MPDNATPEVSEETMDQLREATAQQAVIARSTYSPRERCYTDVSGESIVQQSHKDACDIRNILKDYDKTGLIRHVNQQWRTLATSLRFKSMLKHCVRLSMLMSYL